MIQRCFDPGQVKNWPEYGGKGVLVCERWRNSFSAFLEDLGLKPSARHSIDRFPDGNGNYSCGKCDQCLVSGWKFNCRWATPQEQVRNRCCAWYLTLNGVTRNVMEWVEITGLSYWCLCDRKYRGWTDEEILRTPLRQSQTLTLHGDTRTYGEWAKILGCKVIKLRKRKLRGWSDEKTLTTP